MSWKHTTCCGMCRHWEARDDGRLTVNSEGDCRWQLPIVPLPISAYLRPYEHMPYLPKLTDLRLRLALKRVGAVRGKYGFWKLQE